MIQSNGCYRKWVFGRKRQNLLRSLLAWNNWDNMMSPDDSLAALLEGAPVNNNVSPSVVLLLCQPWATATTTSPRCQLTLWPPCRSFTTRPGPTPSPAPRRRTRSLWEPWRKTGWVPWICLLCRLFSSGEMISLDGSSVLMFSVSEDDRRTFHWAADPSGLWRCS